MFSPSLVGDDEGPLLVPKPLRDEARFDITAMIDLVFMMNIFFLVTSIVTTMVEIDLPNAKHVVVADIENATLVTVMGKKGSVPKVYLGDGEIGPPLLDVTEQDPRIVQAIEQGVAAGKTDFIVKAEFGVPHKDVARVARAASAVDGVTLFLGVMESD